MAVVHAEQRERDRHRESWSARSEAKENILGINIVDSQLGQTGPQPHKVSAGIAYQQSLGDEEGWEARVGIVISHALGKARAFSD